jgi:hypothetical protein
MLKKPGRGRTPELNQVSPLASLKRTYYELSALLCGYFAPLDHLIDGGNVFKIDDQQRIDAKSEKAADQDKLV